MALAGDFIKVSIFDIEIRSVFKKRTSHYNHQHSPLNFEEGGGHSVKIHNDFVLLRFRKQQ